MHQHVTYFVGVRNPGNSPVSGVGMGWDRYPGKEGIASSA